MLQRAGRRPRLPDPLPNGQSLATLLANRLTSRSNLRSADGDPDIRRHRRRLRSGVGDVRSVTSTARAGRRNRGFATSPETSSTSPRPERRRSGRSTSVIWWVCRLRQRSEVGSRERSGCTNTRPRGTRTVFSHCRSFRPRIRRTDDRANPRTDGGQVDLGVGVRAAAVVPSPRPEPGRFLRPIARHVSGIHLGWYVRR